MMTQKGVEKMDREYEYVLSTRFSMAEKIATDLVSLRGKIIEKVGAYYLPIEKKFRNTYPRDKVIVEQYLDGRVLVIGPSVESCEKKFQDFAQKYSEVVDVKFEKLGFKEVKVTQKIQKDINFAVPGAILDTVVSETKNRYLLTSCNYTFVEDTSETAGESSKQIEITLSEERKAGQLVSLKIVVVAPDKETADRILDRIGEKK